MITQIAIGMAAVGAAALGRLCLPAVLRRYQQHRLWKGDLPNIAAWAENDRMETQRTELISFIYRNWPESVAVDLQPRDPISYEERVRLAAAPMLAETLLRIYRARPAAVRVTLSARQHKMQICDARKLGVPVTVSAGAEANIPPAVRERRGRGDDAMRSDESPLRHGRRDERAAEESGRGARESPSRARP